MAGIPRLQEITFLEQAALAVAEGCTFDEIRQRLILHMSALRVDYTGTGNQAAYRLAIETPSRYVTNASESLKELMRLQLVVKAMVPASSRSAQAYVNTKFALTDRGKEWIATVASDPRAAYDELFDALWKTHPQFGQFAEAVTPKLVIPLLGWRDAHVEDLPIDEARESYVDALTAAHAAVSETGDLGWEASSGALHAFVTEYLDERYAFARRRSRPDPYPRSRDFVNACEEAMVKFAFAHAGCEIDYITHEILRRWLGFFGVVNFSYHVPASQALRFWSTAEVEHETGRAVPNRHRGTSMLHRVVESLPRGFDAIRRNDPSASMYVPVYKLRAAVCWDLGMSDASFDAAIRFFVSDRQMQTDVGYSLHLDAAMYGSIPPTERPLSLRSSTGSDNQYYSIGIVPVDERNPS